MTYTPITLTSSGGTFDPYAGFGDFYINYQFSTSGAVTLAANVVVNPTVTAGTPCGFTILWTADLVLSSFSVSICGITFNQSIVNQNGVFYCSYDGTSWTVTYIADGADQPQVYYGVNAVTAATSGTTTWVAGVDRSYQRVSGAPTTLVGNLVYTASTSGVIAGATFTVEIAGGITVGSSSLIVFGITISAYDALNGGVAVVATFDQGASAWRAYATNKQIPVGALSPIAALTAVGNSTNASAAPTTIPFSSAGQVLMRVGSALVAQKITEANLDTDINIISYAATSISNADAKLLFSTPQTLASGRISSGQMNVPIVFILEVIFGSGAFATENTIAIRHVGASNALYKQVGGLATTTSSFYLFVPETGTISTPQMLTNASFEAYCPKNNPTAGTGTTLKIHTFSIQQTLS